MFILAKKQHSETITPLDCLKKDNTRLLKENNILSKRNEELNEEVKRLAALISASNKECSVGPWCKDCDHMRSDKSVTATEEIDISRGRYYYVDPYIDGEVMYCAKHLHELCPEHSKNNQEE